MTGLGYKGLEEAVLHYLLLRASLPAQTEDSYSFRHEPTQCICVHVFKPVLIMTNLTYDLNSELCMLTCNRRNFLHI